MMNINLSGSPSRIITTGMPQAKRTTQPQRPLPSVHVQTSKEFQMLAEHLPTLRAQLSPRENILKSFNDTVNDPMDLDDKVVDKIIAQL